MKNQLACLAGLILSVTAFGQSFDQTMSQSDVDFNHYSVELTSSEGYVLVGTKFDFSSGSNHNNIHIFEMDASGTVLWEQEIDNSDDDRGLDVAVDANGDFVLCGYTVDNGVQKPYVAKFDPSGVFISDLIIEDLDLGAATNIIYSYNTGDYVVGGFTSSSFDNPLANNSTFTMTIDNSLSGIVWSRFDSGVNNEHASINDIVELSNGYFITGSIDYFGGSGYRQGVLAVFIDFNGFTVADLSFSSSNSSHNGVSAVWDSVDDELFLMSNNSVMHAPQITLFANASSSTPSIVSHYNLNLDPNFQGENPAGFELRFSLFDSNNLVACGYYSTHSLTSSPLLNIHATPWLAEFDKYTGNNVNTVLLDVPSPNFHAHGGGLFSTFAYQQPYIYSPEILTERPDGQGYMFVCAHQISGTVEYSLELVSTRMGSEIDCIYDTGWQPSTNAASAIKSLPLDLVPSITNPNLPAVAVGTPIAPSCGVSNKKESNNAPTEWDQNAGKIFPNPFSYRLQLEIREEVFSANVWVMNSLGEVVYRQNSLSGDVLRLEIDLSDQAPGIYLIRVEDSGRILTSEKVIKQ